MEYTKGIFLTESELNFLITTMLIVMEDNCDDKRRFPYRNAKKMYEKLNSGKVK